MTLEPENRNIEPKAESADATRIASVSSTHAENVDATRVVYSSAADCEATRIARDVPDLETEGTRIIGRASLVRLDPAAEPEFVERYRIGDKIGGRYEVLAIHRGTMGVVYGTFDHTEKLPRALKTLQQRHTGDRKMRDMFVEEALTWVRLEKHPFIVRAYLVEQFGGWPYVITEYIRGQEGMGGDLRAWLGHPKLTLPIAVEMALQIAQGMQHAVRKVPGLLHRDLKPANILVDGTARAMVTDFGLAHAEETGAGTPAYMAPEQWRAEKLDTRTDIYAYGCVLYEIFTGHRMYVAHGELEWKASHLTKIPASPMTLNPSLPPQISEFIVRCLAKQSFHRPADWDEVVLECARWFHEITDLPVVLNFPADASSELDHITGGYSFFNLNKLEEALSEFEKALVLDAGNEAIWFMKGHTLADLKRYDQAITAYDQAIVIDPNDGMTWFMKGVTLADSKRYKEALAAYDQAIILDNSALAQHRGYTLQQYRRFALQLSTLSEGSIVKGIVTNITDYGAFVFLGGIDGLLHISDLAWRHVKHTTEVVNIGDEVTAKVLKVDTEKNRVFLGLKQLAADPWAGISRRYREGTRRVGAVTSLSEYGAFVEIEPGVEGLVHMSDMDWTNMNVLPSEMVQAGDNIEVMILNIDEELRRISLGMKQCMPNPADKFARDLKRGDDLAEGRHYDEALAAYDEALALDPTSAKVWNHKGAALGKLKRRDEELAAYDRALALDPNNLDASENKVIALKEIKRAAEECSARDKERAIEVSGAKAHQTKSAALRELWPLEQKPTPPRPKSLWAKLWGK